MTKVVVDGKYTYQTDKDVEVGDVVGVPESWLHKVKNLPTEGIVTAIGSDYDGPCSWITWVVHPPKRGATP